MNERIKFGIISTGWIAGIFAEAINEVENAEKTAVASRTAAKAEKFAEKFGFKKSYGSYDDLFTDNEIDAVYIATPHSEHASIAIAALNAGKHVLCEKAVTVNSLEAEKIVSLAAEKNLFFMEAMWIRFLPAIVELRKYLSDGIIGDVRFLNSHFSNPAINKFDPEHRLFKKELAGGSLLDLGIYPISFASMIFGKQPLKISASAEFNSIGTDNSAAALFSYGDTATAAVSVSFLFDSFFSAEIFGSLGKIRIPSFWWKDIPLIISTNEGKEIVIENRGSSGAKGYSHQIKETVDCIINGRTGSSIMSPGESVEIMKTLDRIRKIIGLEYGADKTC
ncbi:MAG: Gfo/Idh/MocA family oxidoreductase [Spirochaetes bacterium]|nr:Gfo/Idh/MocA family oxidoreductase [Spirochaetota bacterium]